VIGSLRIGASVFGGICNNPAAHWSSAALPILSSPSTPGWTNRGSCSWSTISASDSATTPEDILRCVESGTFEERDIEHNAARCASDHDYCDHVRKVDETTPARFNADPSRLCEASGSAGKVALLAARLDTCPREASTATFYIGTNSVADLAQIRRDILQNFDAARSILARLSAAKSDRGESAEGANSRNLPILLIRSASRFITKSWPIRPSTRWRGASDLSATIEFGIVWPRISTFCPSMVYRIAE
jgi:hypothetical protein